MVLHCNRSPSCFSHSMLLQLTVTPPRKWKLAQTFREKTLSPSPLLSALLFAGLLSLSSSILLKAPPHTHSFYFSRRLKFFLAKCSDFATAWILLLGTLNPLCTRFPASLGSQYCALELRLLTRAFHVESMQIITRGQMSRSVTKTWEGNT